jgi:hypothetical protein
MELSKSKELFLYLLSKDIRQTKKLMKLIKISDRDFSTLVTELENEEFIEYDSSTDTFTLRVKGFDYLLENEERISKFADKFLDVPKIELSPERVVEIRKELEEIKRQPVGGQREEEEEEQKEQEEEEFEYEIPDPDLEKHLLPREKVLASCTDRKVKPSARFYATNKRVIRLQKGLGSENFQDISYREISSLILVSNKNLKLLYIGFVLFVIGMMITTGNAGFGLFIVLISVIFIAGYFLTGRARYEFRGPGLLRDVEYAKIWVIKDSNSKDVENFVRVVRSMLDVRNL